MVNGEADRLGIFDHALEHQFNKRKEVLLKTCEKRGIRHLGETAELPKFLTEGKKKDKEGVGRDRKDFLKDECRKEAVEWINPFSTKGLVEGMGKDIGNKLLNIAMLFKKLEKRGGVLNKKFLAV